MTAWARVSLVAGTALVTACQYDPYTHWYAVRKPDPHQLVGTWRATEESLRALHLQSSEVPEVVLGDDGSIVLRNVPTGWRPPGDVGAARETFSGRWLLERQQDSWWAVGIRKDDWGCTSCLMVMHDKPPHRLVLRYGDPDLGIGLEFERGRRTKA